jgi:L-lactate dehydrogenase complex protein LldG
MSAANEAEFLARIRRALGHPPDRRREPPAGLFPEAPDPADRERIARVRRRGPQERDALFAALAAAAAPIQLAAAALPDPAYATAYISKLAAEKRPEWGDRRQVVAWRHPLIEALALPEALGRAGIPVAFTDPIPAEAADAALRRARERDAVAAAFIGVTAADFCLADTATLVLRNRPGQPRAAATVPSIHVAVIAADQLLADMRELFARLRWEESCRREGLSNYLAFITGPSKTADIEATMVHGAHGPREVHLLVLTG